MAVTEGMWRCRTERLRAALVRLGVGGGGREGRELRGLVGERLRSGWGEGKEGWGMWWWWRGLKDVVAVVILCV